MIPVVIEPLRQKDAGDCAIAAVAMLSGQPYQSVHEAAQTFDRRVRTRGLYTRDILRLARRFGVPLVRASQAADADPPLEGTGLLMVSDGREGHVIVMFQSVAIDPADGQVWDLAALLMTRGWSRGTWYEVAE